MTIIGIVVLLLLLSAAPTYADTSSIEVVNVYDLSREYFTVEKVYRILGVGVILELTTPKLLIHGENQTFTYRILVGDAPSGWLLNITEVSLRSGCFWHQPNYRYVQKLTKVLKGGESLTGQFTVNSTMETWRYYPGSRWHCDPRLTIAYIARFGLNQVADYASIERYINIRAKELPLGFSPNISATIERDRVSLRGEIIMRNTQGWDIILRRYSICISETAWPKNCDTEDFPSSTIIKSGEEYVVKKEKSYYIYHEPPWYVTYTIEYYYPGGSAENWIVLRISKTASAVGTREAKSPTTATAITMTTRTEPAEPLPGVAVGSAMRAAESGIALALTLAPIALVAIAAIAYAARRRSRVVPVPPSQPEQPTPGMAEPQRAVQPRPPPPPEMGARVSAILSKLASARTRLDMGEVNDAILDLHKAVNATISLILDAEGLSAKRPNGRELTMREKFRLLAGRGWVGRGSARHFARLQALRNTIEHYPERIHAPQATASEAEELLRFHEDFVRASLRRLGATASTEGDEGGEKPPYVG